MERSSCPRQIGSIDTGPKECLRSANSSHRVSEHPVQLDQVRGRTVGQGAVGLVPDIFGRVEFRRIGREKVRMESWMGVEPLLDFPTAMDRSPIPQQDHRPPKMPEQVLQERSDIQPREIAGTKVKIEGQPPSSGRHGQGTDRRDPVLLVEIVNDRRFPFGGPGAGHVRDEQETGFIEEDQMGPTSFGVFLYAASGTASNAQSLLRPVAGPDAPVSDSSIRGLPGVSRHGRDGRPRRNAFGSSGRRVLRSTDPSDTRPPGSPSGATWPVASGATWRACAGGPEWVAAAVPVDLSCGRSDTIGTLNSRKHSRHVRRPTDSCPPVAAGWPVGAAAPVAGRFPGVSCPRV